MLSPNWKCAKCDYSSNRKNNYTRHEKTHLSVNQEPNANHITQIKSSKGDFSKEKLCVYCQKSFLNRSNYSRHMLHYCPQRPSIKNKSEDNQPKLNITTVSRECLMCNQESNPLVNSKCNHALYCLSCSTTKSINECGICKTEFSPTRLINFIDQNKN